MKKELLALSIGVLLLIISFSGCVEESKKVEMITIPLNEIDINIGELLDGYILDNETYNDNPPTNYGIKALDTYGLKFNSLAKNENDTVSVWLIRFNSSFVAQESLYNLIPDLPLWLGVSQIYAGPFEQIGDESILYAYFGKGLFEDDLDLNKTAVDMIFRIKNVIGMVEKYVKNIDMEKSEFMYSSNYKNYCNDTWLYANRIEGRINQHITLIEGEEPTGRILELKEIKNESSGTTVVMSAEDYVSDLIKSNISGLRGMFSLYALGAGDALILRDNISMSEYEPLYNDTIIFLNSSEGFHTYIQGNITETYNIGDEVEITVHVMELTYSYLGEEYSVKIIEETWVNLKYYLYYQTFIYSIDTVLPQSQIQKA